MITTPNINGAPQKEPKPLPGFGIHSDSDFFYYFESEQERINFLASIPVIPDQPQKHPVLLSIESMTEIEKGNLVLLLSKQIKAIK